MTATSLPPAAARFRTTVTGAPMAICTWPVVPASPRGESIQARRCSTAATVGFQVDPRLHAAGHGGNIDNPAKLARLSTYDLLPSSPLLGKGLDLERLFKIAPGPCDFRGTPLRPGTQHSPGAIDEPTIATAYDASPAHR